MAASRNSIESSVCNSDEDLILQPSVPIYTSNMVTAEAPTHLNAISIPHNDSGVSPTSGSVSSHAPNTQPSSHPPVPQNDPNTSAPKQPNEDAPRSSIAPGFIDEGEKDSRGYVLEAGHEPCSACGGRVVWATKREWLMICGRCQEPQ